LRCHQCRLNWVFNRNPPAGLVKFVTTANENAIIARRPTGFQGVSPSSAPPAAACRAIPWSACRTASRDAGFDR
jgi:hypothetical protein